MSESLETLRAWFAENKATPEVLLALKHRTAMDPAVTAELMARAPGDSDEEKELGFIFALAQIADKLDALAVLTAGIRVEHLPAVSPAAPSPAVPPPLPAERATVPEVVSVSHVDVTPLAEEHEIHLEESEPPPK